MTYSRITPLLVLLFAAAEIGAQDLACWRMLPVTSASHDAFRQRLADLKKADPDNRWLPVLELYELSTTTNRSGLLAAAINLPTELPSRFPGEALENAQLAEATKEGKSRVQAGIEIISGRTYEPLHALRDLDRALTREADFLSKNERLADAKQIESARDRLRKAYLQSSKHLVEKLFALHLADKTKERDELLAKAKALPYLHDRKHLANILQRLDDEQAWALLIEPLLQSELALIDNPPDLDKYAKRAVAELHIKAGKKTVHDKTIRYEGGVRFRLQAIEVTCDQLTLLQHDDPTAVVMTGDGKVKLHGFSAYPGGINADRFSYHAETGVFSAGGDVRLHAHKKTLKYRACTLTSKGEVRDPRSFLDDFANSFTLDAKLECLPKITEVYDDAELPDEVRFLLALQTLRPHLTWHAPFLPPIPKYKELRDEIQRLKRDRYYSDSPWQEALGGEAWLLADIKPAVEDAYRETRKAWFKKFNDLHKGKEAPPAPPDLPIPEKDLYFWRVRDPQHPDVARAAKLLQGIGGELAGKAYRWREEIRRNNSVLTFDIAGAAPLGKAHQLLMDARNADSVSFKLYRVKKADELLYAANKIGKNFIYRDHGLGAPNRAIKHIEELRKVRDITKRARDGYREVAPAWQKEQLVHQWDVRVADLDHHESYQRRRHSWRWDHDWHDEPDGQYFDDECSEHRERLEKSYRPHDNGYSLSSWQCDRVVTISEKVLAEPGAYVLVAESNGALAHVPIVVEPISLTLRRCRDGVFVLATDAEGKKPLEGATVHARGQIGTAVTDNEGVAFARVLAHGDRPVVVQHEGRYAIGGFGQVFEAIYDHDDHYHDLRARRAYERLKRGDAKDISAHQYADQHVVIAYTDRPTYRPGQDVQFKLIVRKLTPIATVVDVAKGFRAEEFDAQTKLMLPIVDGPVAYSVHDAKGHHVGGGSLTLSEFGTAAGKVTLNEESEIGSYTLRVRIAGQQRIVPEVFAVKHYRRPNFEIVMTGVPDKLAKSKPIKVDVACQYYFGPPVAKGAVEVRVFRKNFGKALVVEKAELDDKGKVKVKLELPTSLEAGKYQVVCSVTDDSGRTVSKSMPLVFEPPHAPKTASGLATLPRFVAVNQELKVASTVKEVRVQQSLTDLRVPVKDGTATLKFVQPGWYHLEAGDDECQIFAYGGDKHPLDHVPLSNVGRDYDPPIERSKWVNLSDFAFNEHHDQVARWENPDQHLFALFDRQTLKPGENLRLLVYVPDEKSKLLFTIEGRTILDYAIVWTKEKAGKYQIVEIPIKERYVPNVYVQGRIVGGARPRILDDLLKQESAKQRLEREYDDDRDPRWCRIDVLKPAGKHEDELNVQITTDAATYRPGDSVQAKIKVTNRDGVPQKAELSLAAVDESVFAFGEDNLDALAGFFHAPYETRRFLPKVWRVSVGDRWSKKASDGKKGDLKDQLMKSIDKLEHAMKQSEAIQQLEANVATTPELSFTAAPLPRLDGELPTSEIPLGKLREHFHETAIWLPQLVTDDAGSATAIFTLPDSLTRYRLASLALTKATEIGVGRGRITAGLPLAVQVFVPRFGVEKDRLQAVGLIHNSSDKERDCSFTWRIEGAIAEAPSPIPQDWKLINDKGIFTASGKIKLPAKGSAKVGVWLTLDKVGTARIELRANDGKENDRELRSLPVHPVGKPAVVEVNEAMAVIPQKKAAEKQVAGAFHKEGRVQLPPGFLANELHISLAASDLAQALDGLDYLVDYPHGCIEQTMSRFMPVVMIKHATQHSPVKLQPAIEKKLPDILAKGLTRVYGHQHADGSWGWFQKDGQNLPMSVYVLYGLARSKSTGTAVDADVLKRGCEYLQAELKTNKHPMELTARAWYVLALAGHADAKDLEKLALEEATQVHSYRPLVWCNLALACREAGLNETGERLWAKVHLQLRNSWWGHDTESFALILNTQLAFGAPYRECRTMAERILAKRSGTSWAHTRDTSWAIESLAGILGYVQEKSAVRKVEITLGGKAILEVNDAAELKKMVYRVHLKGDQLPAQEGLEIRMKADSDEPIHVAVRAVGVQRQDEVKASGTRIKLQRFIETLDGKSAPATLKVGQVVRVRLKLGLAQSEDYLLLEERRGSLCEFAHDRIAGASAGHAVHQEFRDDRLCVFFTSLPAGSHEIIYYVRAETMGLCTVLPGQAYPMYDDKIRGETASSKVEVKE